MLVLLVVVDPAAGLGIGRLCYGMEQGQWFWLVILVLMIIIIIYNGKAYAVSLIDGG